MRTAVMRVVIDPAGALSPGAYEQGLDSLRAAGVEVVASPAKHLPDKDREIELIVDDVGPEATAQRLQQCGQAFGMPARAGVVTFVSRGTDEDAAGVLQAFGISGSVARVVDDDEVVTVTIARSDLRRVPESRLHTALEAALNCEVRISTA